MRPTPQLSVKTCGGGGGGLGGSWGEGDRREGGMGGYWQLGGRGGVPRGGGGGGGAAHDPLLPHAYLKGVCVCVFGGMGVCMQ